MSGQVSRRLKVLLYVIASVGAFGFLCAVVLYLTRDRVTEDNYKMIKEDMSRRDVESILGKPTEDEPVSPRDPTGGTRCLWRGRNHSTIYVRFDKEGKIVDESYFGPTEPEKQDLLERAIRAVGLDK